jgi:hypothetical protein
MAILSKFEGLCLWQSSDANDLPSEMVEGETVQSVLLQKQRDKTDRCCCMMMRDARLRQSIAEAKQASVATLQNLLKMDSSLDMYH